MTGSELTENTPASGTITLTPTWSGLLPMMLAAFAAKESMEIREEFASMARAADAWNAHCKEVNDE